MPEEFTIHYSKEVPRRLVQSAQNCYILYNAIQARFVRHA